MRWRRRPAPSDVVARAGLASGEKVLAHGTTVDGDTVLATRERLLLVGADDVRWARGWSRVDSAAWDDDGSTLHVEWLGEPPSSLQLTDPSPSLPEVVRERVESSVVTSRRVDVRGRGRVRLVVRRAGEGLALQVVPDAGTRLDDPAVRAAVAQARAELVDQVGALPETMS